MLELHKLPFTTAVFV